MPDVADIDAKGAGNHQGGRQGGDTLPGANQGQVHAGNPCLLGKAGNRDLLVVHEGCKVADKLDRWFGCVHQAIIKRDRHPVNNYFPSVFAGIV